MARRLLSAAWVYVRYRLPVVAVLLSLPFGVVFLTSQPCPCAPTMAKRRVKGKRVGVERGPNMSAGQKQVAQNYEKMGAHESTKADNLHP